MASPITATDFQLTAFGSDVCENIRKLLEINDKLRIFFDWAFASDGTLNSAFKVLMQDVAVAPGCIVFMPVEKIPAGYLVCNGQLVSRTTYINLFAILGTTSGVGDGSTTFALPDLQGKFLMGASGIYPVGNTGGTANETLIVAQIPAHTHGPGSPDGDSAGFLEKTNVAGKTYDVSATGDAVVSPLTGSTGGSQSHNNLPPYRSGYWLVKH